MFTPEFKAIMTLNRFIFSGNYGGLSLRAQGAPA